MRPLKTDIYRPRAQEVPKYPLFNILNLLLFLHTCVVLAFLKPYIILQTLIPNEFYLRYVFLYNNIHVRFWEYAVAQLVEALRYKPEGYGFDSR